jgi:pimeloyl-ACP methyl ester carboxylesterase
MLRERRGLWTLQAGRWHARRHAGAPLRAVPWLPELWCSWRAQMAALAAAGFRAAAPDMRGYGGTDAPPDPAQYTMLHHVGDLVALVQALGEQQAVAVGHDWGAPAAWHAALLRPDVFRAVAGLSVPYSPPGPVDLLTALESQGITTFYMQYFQTPGVAEVALEADVAASLRRITYSLSGDAGRRGHGAQTRYRLPAQHRGSSGHAGVGRRR